MPERFPTKFWHPVQRPAAHGPARVWVTAHKFEEKIPYAKQAALRSTSEMVGSRTIAASSITVESSRPAPVNVLRTRLGLAPHDIQRSERKPNRTVEPATTHRGIDPKMAIWFCV